jgi:hypothetical protein
MILERALKILFGVVLFAAMSSYVYIHLDYAANVPRIPQPAQGRVHRIAVNHGSICYVTQEELDRANLITGQVFDIGLVMATILLALHVYVEKYHRSHALAGGGADERPRD